MIPGRNNHRVVGLSVEHRLGPLLDEGVRVFLWDGAMIHAKSVVIDEIWTLIGSSNLDSLSLDRNAELNVEIHGSAVAEAMARLFWEDSALCQRSLKVSQTWREVLGGHQHAEHAVHRRRLEGSADDPSRGRESRMEPPAVAVSAVFGAT